MYVQMCMLMYGLLPLLSWPRPPSHLQLVHEKDHHLSLLSGEKEEEKKALEKHIDGEWDSVNLRTTSSPTICLWFTSNLYHMASHTVYVCTYVCMYVCMYECMYVCMYVCLCVCVCVCMYVCVYVCMYVCMCVYVCTYVCMYVCMTLYSVLYCT